MKKAKKRRVGRPRYEFTPEQIKKAEEMAFNFCKDGTIATILGCDDATLRKYLSPRLHKKRAEGKAELRKNQRRMSKTQVAMAIFLGKNQLNQTDKRGVELSGKLDAPVPVVQIIMPGGKADNGSE